MPDRLRFLPAGPHALLIELENLSATLALHDRLAAELWPEVTALIPAARTLLLGFDPLLTDRITLIDRIAALAPGAPARPAGRQLTLPVFYDGEDLAKVAAHLGLTVEALIARHLASTYRVAFTGFAPGFAYMQGDDALFDVPRKTSPRLKIPAGAVALGGTFCGIYPSDSPGGWQILGRTPVPIWDEGRSPPAFLAPGDQLRFTRIGAGEFAAWPQPKAPTLPSLPADLQVLRADLPALFQDLGRPRLAAQGISRSGAMDRAALLAANRLLGNRPDAPVVELASGGFSLRAAIPATLALTGADCALALSTARGEQLSLAPHQPFALDPGDVLTIGHARAGARAYLAARGGFRTGLTLGSAARDTLAKLGPAPIRAGDGLAIGAQTITSVSPDIPRAPALPKPGDLVTLRVHLGPRSDWFTAEGLQHFLTQDWLVTPQADRIGIRLSGATPIAFATGAELPSEATPLGAIQVPRSGEPVLFLADHPLTGGYPVIAVLAPDQLDLAGQIPIGARLRFTAVSDFAPITRIRPR